MLVRGCTRMCKHAHHSRRDDCQSILVQNEKPKLNMNNSDSQQDIKNDSVH